jgi:hypothetical protein
MKEKESEKMKLPEKYYKELRTHILGMESDMNTERYNQVMLKFSPLLQRLENMRTHISEEHYRTLRSHILIMETDTRMGEYNEVKKKFTELLQTLEDMHKQ